MSHIVVIRPFKAGDERNCVDTVKDGVWSPLNSAFFGFIFKEITFQMMVLLAAIMFIFFGVPITVCIIVIPTVIVLTYAATYIGFKAIAIGIEQEISNVSRIYMSNAFSCFWVAEAFEPYLTFRNPMNCHYNVMTEKQFRDSKIDISSQKKRIVGTIALCKSYTLDKGAWVKRLYVAKDYRRKGIASCLLKAAIDFATAQGYSSVSTAASEYDDGGRELCFKKGFELKQMYHKTVMGSVFAVLMYELICQIKPGNNSYASNLRSSR